MQTFTISLPGDPRAIELLRALKGAPLSCLVALRIAHPKPLDRDQLTLMTGWKKDLVTNAMKLLCDLYMFATRIARYRGWILTDVGKQLALPGLSPLLEKIAPRALDEGDLIALPPHVCMNDDDALHSHGGNIIHASEGDFIALPQSETYPLVSEILASAGIEGPNLDKLAATVTPDIAEKWKYWIENCERKTWKSPHGFCYRALTKNPNALPPPIKQQDPPRVRKFSITGRPIKKESEQEE